MLGLWVKVVFLNCCENYDKSCKMKIIILKGAVYLDCGFSLLNFVYVRMHFFFRKLQLIISVPHFTLWACMSLKLIKYCGL